MNDDIRWLFSTVVHAKLKQRIKGKIFCRVYGDTLKITIESIGGVSYTMEIDDFAEKVINGYTADYAAHEVVNGFKKHLQETFFY